MKEKGNESFKNGDHFDAMWKYVHSYSLLHSIQTPVPALIVDANKARAVLHSNMAACCLKLGDKDRTDLLRSLDGSPVHRTMWYGHANQQAHLALCLKPNPNIASKVSQCVACSMRRLSL